MCVCSTESAGCAVRPPFYLPLSFSLRPAFVSLCVAAHSHRLSGQHWVNSMAAARGCVLMWVSTDVGALHAAAAWHWPYCSLEGMRSCRQARLKCIHALARNDTATCAQVRGMCWGAVHCICSRAGTEALGPCSMHASAGSRLHLVCARQFCAACTSIREGIHASPGCNNTGVPLLFGEATPHAQLVRCPANACPRHTRSGF